MATNKPTPRMNKGLTLSRGKSSVSTSRVQSRRSNNSRVAALKEDDKSSKRCRSISDLTPRTLIQGVLQNTEVEPQLPPPKRPRPSTPGVTRPRPKTPGTLPHSSTRRRITRLETLATPGADPTPRSLIQGLVGTAPVETPAVHLRRSSTLDPVDFPDVEEAVQGRENRGHGGTLSPFIQDRNESQPNQSQPPQSNLRKRRPINMDDFAAGVRERLTQKKQDGDAGTIEEVDQAEASAVDREETESTPIALEQGADVDLPTDEDASQEDDVGRLDDGAESDASHDHDEAGENEEEDLEQSDEHPGMANSFALAPIITPTPSPSHMPPPLDHSTAGSASKQAADSTWMGRESATSTLRQRRGSPSGMRRVPDSTVGDSESEGDTAPGASHQALDSELSLGGDGITQQTVAGSQSGLSVFSPLVTPRLPLGGGRRTPALKKTPAPQTAQREQSPAVVPRPPPPQKKKSTRAPRKDTLLPTSLTKSILSHFSKARVSKEAVAAVEKGAETFFKRLSNDLVVYSNHAHRQTIDQSDVELLMRRQGLIQDQQSLYALIEKYLPMEYRQELIPMATAGNKVIPKPPH